MRRCGVIAVSVILVACCLCGVGSAGVGYFVWSAQPALAKEMHDVNWSEADASSWEAKNEQLKGEIKKAHDAGSKEQVELEVTEAESTAMIARMAGGLGGGQSSANLKKDLDQGTGGWVKDFSSPKVNYINGAAYVSSVVKVRGFDVNVVVKYRTEIVNGRPRLFVEKYEAGLIPIPQQFKDLASEWLGPGGETLTFTVGPNNYTVSNLIFYSDNSFSIDYSIEGVTEYMEVQSVSMQSGKMVMRGVTR